MQNPIEEEAPTTERVPPSYASRVLSDCDELALHPSERTTLPAPPPDGDDEA